MREFYSRYAVIGNIIELKNTAVVELPQSTSLEYASFGMREFYSRYAVTGNIIEMKNTAVVELPHSTV